MKVQPEGSQKIEKKKPQRKYYEVWGDTMNLVYFLRTVVIVLAALCIYLAVMLKKSIDKPPLVIKVDQLGQTQAIPDWQSNVSVSKPEIVNFTQTFIELFTSYNYYTYNDSFKKAFKMMTLEFQRKADEFLQSNQVVKTIQQAQYKTTTNISKIDIVKDTKENVILKIKGYREQRSYLNPDFYKEIIFEAELVISKVKRDFQNPWGMLVENYSETIIKEK